MLNPLSFISKIFKSNNQKEIEKIQHLLKKVNDLEKEISSLDDEDFPKKTADLKLKLNNGNIRKKNTINEGNRSCKCSCSRM